MGYIDADELRALAEPMRKNEYGQYLLDLLENAGRHRMTATARLPDRVVGLESLAPFRFLAVPYMRWKG